MPDKMASIGFFLYRRNDSLKGPKKKKKGHNLTECLEKSTCKCFNSKKKSGSVRTVSVRGKTACVCVWGGVTAHIQAHAEEDVRGHVLVQCSHP